MKYHSVFRMFLLQSGQVIQAVDVGHPITTLRGKCMGHDLIIPEIHIQRQLIVDTVHPECCHITDDAFQRPVNNQLGRQQVREYPERIAWFLILIVLCLAFDTGNPAALMRIRV